MDHTEFKLKQKKITARKITTQRVFVNTPCTVQHLLYKGGTKGARTEHKSTGVPINFLSQLLKCKSLRQDMNFMCLLLSCCLASLPKRMTFFSLFTLIFQEENLPRGKAECSGFVTPGIRSEACKYWDTPTAPVTSRYETRETNSIRQPTGKWKLFLFPQGLHALGDVSSCRRNACALRRQRDSGAIRDVHVGFVAKLQILICLWLNSYLLRVAKCTAPQHALICLHLGQENSRNTECWSRAEGTVHSLL